MTEFLDAWAAVDVPRIVALLSDDALLTMPPVSLRFDGAGAIGQFLATQPAQGLRDRIKHTATPANRQPTLASYADEREGRRDQATAILRRMSDPRTRSIPLRAALGTMVAASAAPYGYTVTIWSSGAVLMHAHGVPSIADVFLFLAGALTGFGLLGLLAHGAVARMESLDHAGDRVIAGTLHWLAVGSAVGCVTLIALVHDWEAWPLGSFAATTIYIAGASLQLALVTARHTRTRRK